MANDARRSGQWIVKHREELPALARIGRQVWSPTTALALEAKHVEVGGSRALVVRLPDLVLPGQEQLEVTAELVGWLTELPDVRLWRGQLRFRDRARGGLTSALVPLRAGNGNFIAYQSAELIISAAIAVSR